MVGSISVAILSQEKKYDNYNGVNDLGYSSFSFMGFDFSLAVDMVQCNFRIDLWQFF